VPRTELRETVARLRSEIESGGSPDPHQIQLLSEALDEIDGLLESEDAASSLDSPLIAKLNAAEAHFEETHPKLTLAVGAVAHALSKLGI